jgi:hypothetical protein
LDYPASIGAKTISPGACESGHVDPIVQVFIKTIDGSTVMVASTTAPAVVEAFFKSK